jgi:hypothetical protein
VALLYLSETIDKFHFTLDRLRRVKATHHRCEILQNEHLLVESFIRTIVWEAARREGGGEGASVYIRENDYLCMITAWETTVKFSEKEFDFWDSDDTSQVLEQYNSNSSSKKAY